MRLKVTTILLLPVLVIQGYQVKKNTLKLPEPEGARQGVDGEGKALSILIIGDSAAAGVGVRQQKEALSGCIISELDQQFRISWKLVARTGHTSAQVIESIEQIQAQSFDVIISSIGVNDVTKLMPAKQWIEQQQIIYQLLQAKFSPKLIIAASVPPMNLFPALPNPLAWLLGQYSKAMNQRLEKYIKSHPQMDYIEYDIEQYRDLNLEMAADGFHPSRAIYQLWAQQVAEKIKNRF